MQSIRNIRNAGIISLLFTGILLLGGIFSDQLPVYATEVDELEEKISDRNNRIEELEKEIRQYETQLQEVQSRKQTLESAVEELELSQQRLNADIALTQEKINALTLTIQELENDIEETEKKISEQREAIGVAIRKIDEVDSTTLVEKILARETLAEIWSTIDTLEKFQLSLKQNLKELQSLKAELASKKEAEAAQRKEQVTLRASLEDKRQIVLQQKQEQKQLLTQTENKESNYRSLISEKRQQKERFEQELQQFEEQLQIAIDESRLPTRGTTVFDWPFDGVPRITQHFGGSRFAQQNPHVYGRPFHNGTDFGLPVGTPIKAVRGGTIKGTGNTDAISGCYSYGKWILIEHDNGLSTLYAHLSLIKAQEGQRVNTGEVIGYSGNTGYSTGPHLHLTTYATEGVRIVRLGDVKTQTSCGNAHIPVATTDAYLDSLSYLPDID